MGQPDWSRISPDKWPEWKKQEVLASSKKTIETIELINKPVDFVCEVCGKICKNNLGLIAHKRSHNK